MLINVIDSLREVTYK